MWVVGTCVAVCHVPDFGLLVVVGMIVLAMPGCVRYAGNGVVVVKEM